jgi:alpha-galactosidase
MLLVLLVGGLLMVATHGLDNGLARTPQMGWNSWNFFACDVNETIIREAAAALVSSGLKAAGYTYINIDDCWALGRFPNGTVYADPISFPSGMAALASYVHSLGLKIGLYSDAGNFTCAGRPGSLGYERTDAMTYASWGFDYLKYDNCNNDNIAPQTRYPVMRDALNATGRQIFFSLCEWGQDDPGTWAPLVGNSWRTTGDIKDFWTSVLKNLLSNDREAPYAGPGGWNDPDMLEVGNGGLSEAQEMSHFSLWALIKAPLIVGCDLNNMSQATLNILSNSEVIAVNQDSLGVQGKLVTTSALGLGQVWAGPLSDGSVACVIMNLAPIAMTVTATWEALQLPAGTPAVVRDLWAHQNLGNFTGSFGSHLPASGASLTLRITPLREEDRAAVLRAWGH